MTARTEDRPSAAVQSPPAPLSLGRRLSGTGSLFGKTIRDSRRAFLVMVMLVAGAMFLVGAASAQAFGTVELRRDAAVLASSLPSLFQGMLGKQVGLDTLGGLIEWRYPTLFFLIAPIWSILALSGTLASEAKRGSLEYLATTPLTRRRIALEKLLGHVTMVALLVAATAVAAVATGAVFGTLPGDAITPGAGIGFALLVGLAILASGSVAFALAPFLGRGASAGVAAVVLVAMFVVNGYRSSIGLFETLTPLSWFSWTANHIPLAGEDDWPSLVPMAVITLALLVAGVVAFERRDVGSTIAIRYLGFPRFLAGVTGPISRSFGDRLPGALAWGIGLGLYAAVIATSGDAMAQVFRQFPRIEAVIHLLYPNIDYTSAGGVLQLAFVQFAVVALGFATATLVSGWASDETAGPLEVVLTTPLSRFGWVVRSGLGVYAAIAVMCAVIGAGIALGAASVGSDAVTPITGLGVLALYLMALTALGIAVGGWLRPGLAPIAIAVLTLWSFVIDLFGPPLKLPDPIQQLSLSKHLGQPMVGLWDVGGTVAWVVIAIGALLLGGWGLSRRDLRG
jgi:ABC-2 type transport system permease protein